MMRASLARKQHAENHLEIIDAIYAMNFIAAASMTRSHPG